jgi:hypothetical protein
MWLFINIGFFSIVQKPNESFLTVRSRVEADIDRLREECMPSLSSTVTGAGTDYPYRATISHEDFAKALGAVARNINYSNFKNEVAKRMGPQRARIYSKVWSSLLELEKAPKKDSSRF